MPQERIEAPIPGKILRVDVSEGNYVEEGGVICFIESMKMENPILAPVGGRVVQVAITPGQFVHTGDLLAVIEY